MAKRYKVSVWASLWKSFSTAEAEARCLALKILYFVAYAGNPIQLLNEVTNQNFFKRSYRVVTK